MSACVWNIELTAEYKNSSRPSPRRQGGVTTDAKATAEGTTAEGATAGEETSDRLAARVRARSKRPARRWKAGVKTGYFLNFPVPPARSRTPGALKCALVPFSTLLRTNSTTLRKERRTAASLANRASSYEHCFRLRWQTVHAGSPRREMSTRPG